VVRLEEKQRRLPTVSDEIKKNSPLYNSEKRSQEIAWRQAVQAEWVTAFFSVMKQ
jgi:hypothetical protein